MIAKALLLASLLMVGCATTGARNAESAGITCEMGALPATLGKLALAALEMALNENSNTDDLKQVGIGAAPGQAECVFRAVLAWLNTPSTPAATDAPMPVVTALMASHNDVARRHARLVLGEYLASVR